MSNVVIPYQDIVNKITEQFYELHSDIKFEVSDEQMFAKLKDRDPDTLYIVIHFGEAAINFGVAVCNITIEALSIQNEVEITKQFLNDYVNRFNRAQDTKMTQFYVSPTDSLNFNQVYEGFRSLFVISGTLLISNNVVSLGTLTYHYGENQSETIDVIAYNETTENSLNPQPYPNTYGRTKSYGSFQTFAFSIVTYPDGNKQLIKDIWAMKFDETKSHQNDIFVFSATFINIETTMPQWEFKCRSADLNQRIGEMPVLTLAFSR